MKAILEFSLPEENYEFECAQHGHKWKMVVDDALVFLRNTEKYGHKYASADEAVSDIRKSIYQFIDDRSLTTES